jgi:hypothetical protein
VNTLGKTITSRFYATEGGFFELRARWSKLMQDKEARKALTVQHHTLYSLLIGRDWRKGFTAPAEFTERSASPESVIDSLSALANKLNKQPTLTYYVLGEANAYGYRPQVPCTTDNPFFGLLAEGAGEVVESYVPLFKSGEYLPETAYTLAYQKQGQEVAA